MLKGYTDFGLDVRLKLLQRHKTISWLAKNIGCSVGQLSEMLKGSRELQPKDNDWKKKIEVILNDQSGGKEVN
jgi:hypothetical protein